MVLTVRVQADGARPVRIWLPLILVWILLLPFLVLIVPVVMILGALAGMNPLTALASFFGVFCALAGTHVEVEAPDAHVLLHIS